MTLGKGDRRDVPEWTWADLARDAQNENVSYKAGDSCGLMKGGQVEVIGLDRRYGVLVRYRLPAGETKPAGTKCPTGAILFLEADVLESWPMVGEVAAGMLAHAEDRERAVKRLLGERE